MGIKTLYRDDYPVHLLVKVPNLAHQVMLDTHIAIHIGREPKQSDVLDWLNQNAPGWELCYLSSRPVTFQVDEYPDDDPETCIRFKTAEQATLFRMFFE